MKDKYSKNIATVKLSASQATQLVKICPVFKKQCFENCASFNEGNVTRLDTFNYNHIKKENPDTEDEYLKIWSIYECSCTNAIVTGYIQCDMNQ